MAIKQSAEDYLERILMLKNQNGSVKSIDIAVDMGFSKPSISVAMKKLKESGYIIVLDNGSIELTDEGLKLARNVYDRHETISSLLMKIGVNEEQALIDACKIEHDISEETFIALKKVLNNL